MILLPLLSGPRCWCGPPNDLRISCKRLARRSLSYVPLNHHRQIASHEARPGAACRLHALLVELVPGGIPKQITANRAAALLASMTPASPVEATRHALALEHLEDLRRLDEQMRASKRRILRRGRGLSHVHH